MAVSNEDKGSDPFFPSIRDTAERIDLATPEEGDASSAIDRKEGQDESPIQEIDSLCMTCGEQVPDFQPPCISQANIQNRDARGCF